MTSSVPVTRIALAAAVLSAAAALIPAGSAEAARCAPAAPALSIDNNYAWGASGSYGEPGQQLTYAIHVANEDAGCGSSTFTVALAASTGFTVSLPSPTISLASTSSGYVFATVTSPVGASAGTYALNATVTRTTGTSSAAGASATSAYMVYTSDAVAPTLFYPNPWDGATLSGKSYSVAVSSSDDHAVQRIELSIDGVYTTTATCSDISYTCQLFYKWSLHGVRGAHTITFRSYDWAGNVGWLTVSFTVG